MANLKSKVLQKINALFHRLKGFAIASSLDLKYSYLQLRIKVSDRRKTGFTWRGIKYKFIGAPVGLLHLTQHMQILMEILLSELEFCVIIWVDDIIVFSKSSENHAEHVIRVLQRLNAGGARLRHPKCHWGYVRLKILGHIHSGDGRRPDPAKLTTLNSCPNHWQASVCISGILQLSPCRRSSHSAACVSLVSRFPHTFEYMKDDVMPVLGTNVSQFGIGIVVFQFYDGRKHYILFASTSLKGAQRNYPANKRELLGVDWGLQRARQYLYGIWFELCSITKV